MKLNPLFLASVLLIIFAIGCQRKVAISDQSAPSRNEVKKKNTLEQLSEDARIVGSAREILYSGDSQAAIAELSRAIELNKKNPDAYYYRAVAKWNIGDTEGSCADYAMAGKLGHQAAGEMLEKYCSK